MLSKIIKFIVIFAVIALVINIFPNVYDLVVDFINWIMSFGKWGVIALTTCIVIAIIDRVR
jgi:hypothetical protein